MAEYRRFGHHANTSWVRPSPPPMENDPLYRMPVLRPSRFETVRRWFTHSTRSAALRGGRRPEGPPGAVADTIAEPW
jgi:hypothetical protein